MNGNISWTWNSNSLPSPLCSAKEAVWSNKYHLSTQPCMEPFFIKCLVHLVIWTSESFFGNLRLGFSYQHWDNFLFCVTVSNFHTFDRSLHSRSKTPVQSCTISTDSASHFLQKITQWFAEPHVHFYTLDTDKDCEVTSFLLQSDGEIMTRVTASFLVLLLL